MSKLIADTNIFLRLILNDIPSQADEVEKLVKKAKRGDIKISVPQIIIFEIEYALSKYYKFPKTLIIDKLEAILAASYFSIQDGNIFKKSLKNYREKSLRLVDCFLIAKSEIEKMKIFTFDKDLSKLITREGYSR